MLDMISKMYEARKQSQGGNRETQHDENGRFTASSQNGALRNGKTSVAIAKELGVGQKTVERAEKFAKGVDVLKQVSKDAADKVLKGQAKVKGKSTAEPIIDALFCCRRYTRGVTRPASRIDKYPPGGFTYLPRHSSTHPLTGPFQPGEARSPDR